MSTLTGSTTPSSSLPPAAHAACEILGLDPETLARAHQSIQTRQACLLLVSGKIASGKDTVAPLVLEELGYTTGIHLSWADALKDEVDEILVYIRTCANACVGEDDIQQDARRLACAEEVRERFQIPAPHNREYVSLLWEELRADESLHARSRTPGIRRVLQLHGTEVRRAGDPEYWIKRGMQRALAHLARGESVYFTDSRFPNEVELPQAVGGIAVRLDISPEVQRARLQSRDGLPPDERALTHRSETSLDEFAGFDVRITNEGTLADALTAIAAGLNGHAHQS